MDVEDMIVACEKSLAVMREFRRTLTIQQRATVFEALRRRGLTFTEIGLATGYSRERIRTILKKRDRIAGV